jgi:hypothetical protein
VPSPDYIVFRLIVSERKSVRGADAFAKLTQLCSQLLPGRHIIRVVYLDEEPAFAEENEILATPVILTNLPGRLQTFIGDLQRDSSLRIAIEKAL